MTDKEYTKPRGFADILPEEVFLWQYLEDTVHNLFSKFGYSQIRVPHMEETELFVRSIGETTDIVEKEMFTFEKEDGSLLSLRPEITASLCRAVIENHLRKSEPFQKLYYIGPSFRYEKPQKGRLRQFHQIGVEAIGADDPYLDLETMQLFTQYLEEIGVTEYTLHLNSMGCPECRPTYRERLQEYIQPRLNGLCDNCQSRFDRNVFRILDCKKESCQEALGEIPRIYESHCEECTEHWDAVVNEIRKLSIQFKKDPRLARGLDYYTKTVYEVRSDSLGAQNALGGGGRYDGLMEELGGEPAGGIGFAMGIERIILALREQTGFEDSDIRTHPDLYLVSVNDDCHQEAFFLANRLRRENIAVDLNFEDRSLKSQMRVANRSGAPLTGILGPEEIEQNVITIKTMESGEEERVKLKELEDYLRNHSLTLAR